MTSFNVVQDILGADQQVDKSGNPILKDAGIWLRNELKSAIPDTDMKYIDPSYLIRSIPTISGDRIYCKVSSLILLQYLPPTEGLAKSLGNSGPCGSYT